MDENSKVDGKNEYKAYLRTGELARTLKQHIEGQPMNTNELSAYEYSIQVDTQP